MTAVMVGVRFGHAEDAARRLPRCAAAIAVVFPCGPAARPPWAGSPELVDWVPYAGNPLFAGTGGGPGTARSASAASSAAKGRTEARGTRATTRAGARRRPSATPPRATGCTGRRYPRSPVFDGAWTEDVFVGKHRGVFQMFAEGVNDVAHRLHVEATACAGRTQGPLDVRKRSGEPIAAGAYGTPPCGSRRARLHLFYEREDKGVWLATSRDLPDVDERAGRAGDRPRPRAYDLHAVAVNQVVRYQGRYYAVYHANADPAWKGPWTTVPRRLGRPRALAEVPGNPVIRSDDSSGILVDDGDAPAPLHHAPRRQALAAARRDAAVGPTEPERKRPPDREGPAGAWPGSGR